MKKEEGRVESRGEGNETEGSSAFELLSLSLSLVEEGGCRVGRRLRSSPLAGTRH